MASFENLRREELMILTKLRNADDYKNMSREQLKYIFATLSVTKAAITRWLSHGDACKRCREHYCAILESLMIL